MSKLRELGFDKLVMMTGDSERTARAVAEHAGLDEYYAEVLPEDKAAFIRAEHEKGRKVIMIGDGVNDSPALSEADAGIAMSDGAAIAREIADITICSDDLESLVTLKRISDGLILASMPTTASSYPSTPDSSSSASRAFFRPRPRRCCTMYRHWL